jgi:hypothetical protein
MSDRKFVYQDVQIVLGEKLEERTREVLLLINIVAADPRYQPWYLSDAADVFSIREQGEDIIQPRLEGYFGKPLKFRIRHGQPLWQLLDEIKTAYPDWPDAWE